jgi:hypothetical protein
MKPQVVASLDQATGKGKALTLRPRPGCQNDIEDVGDN